MRQLLRSLVARLRFAHEFCTYRAMARAAGSRFELAWRDRYQCLDDATEYTGFDRHYVYHTAWAARMIARTRPSAHVDISSSVYFCSIASAFVPVRFYDFRMVDLRLSDLTIDHADVTNLPFADGTISSLSCMHVVEHIGLGRYGDLLDSVGDLKAIKELQRVLAPGGSLLFVVPIGRPVIRFNAHRIYAYRQVIEAFDALELAEWSLIPDHGDDPGPVENASEELANAQEYACGCFRFIRRAGAS